MQGRLKFWVATALLAVAFLPGCATQVYDKESLFKPNNRFAIVSFAGRTNGLGMSQAEDEKMITDLDEVVYKELNQSRYFKLVPPSTVKASRIYAAIPSESTDGIYTLKVAHGYKKFDPKKHAEHLKKLMDELKLSGVIQVSAVYTKTEKSAYMSGLLKIPFLSGGVAGGQVNYQIVAYNNKNEVIWQDSIEATTKDSTVMIMGIANVAKLYPQLVDITQDATRIALKNLDEKVAKGQ